MIFLASFASYLFFTWTSSVLMSYALLSTLFKAFCFAALSNSNCLWPALIMLISVNFSFSSAFWSVKIAYAAILVLYSLASNFFRRSKYKLYFSYFAFSCIRIACLSIWLSISFENLRFCSAIFYWLTMFSIFKFIYCNRFCLSSI